MGHGCWSALRKSGSQISFHQKLLTHRSRDQKKGDDPASQCGWTARRGGGMPAGPRAVLSPSLPLEVLPSAEVRSSPRLVLASWTSLEEAGEGWLLLVPPSSVSPLRRSLHSTNEKRAVIEGANGATSRLRIDWPTVWCRRSCSQLLGCLHNGRAVHHVDFVVVLPCSRALRWRLARITMQGRAQRARHSSSYRRSEQVFASSTYAAASSRDASSDLNSPNVRAAHMQ